jgi:uncharacterized protein (TIGR02147 family)
MKAFDPTQFQDLRTVLKAFVEFSAQRRNPLSMRGIAARAGFKSPNHLQRIISGERGLSAESAKRLGEACGFSGPALRYFCKLAELAAKPSPKQQQEIFAELKQIIRLKSRHKETKEDIFDHWLNLILIEFAQLADFEMSIDALYKRLRSHATKQELEHSLRFLLKQKILTPTDTPHRYRCEPVDFAAIHDGRRRLNIQQAHLRYLELAKLRIAAPMDERSLQALTVAIPKAKLALVRERMIYFLDQLNDELSGDATSDQVLHIQVAALLL